MDVRIGVTDTPKELDIEMAPDADPDSLRSEVATALADGGVFWLTDKRGRQIGVPTERIAYVDIGTPDAEKRIGFGA